MITLEDELDSVGIYDNEYNNIDWLELTSVPDNVHNPLLDRPIGLQYDPVNEMVKLMMDKSYLHFSTKHILNIDMMPFQLAILDTLWTKKMPMLIGSRGLSKSYSLAVYCILRMIFQPGCRIIIVGAAFRQSKIIFDYMTDIWDKSPILRDISGGGKKAGPRREIDRCEFYIGDSRAIAIPVGDGCAKYLSLLTLHDKFTSIGDLVSSDKSKESEIKQEKNIVWSNGKFRESDEKYYNGIKDTKIINTRSGFNFEATHNHKLKVLRNNKIEFIRMDEMVVGDSVLIDRSYRWHNGNIDATIDECYALGAMIGDGCWTNKYKLGFASIDPDRINMLNNGNFGKEWVKAKDNHFNLNGKEHIEKWLDKWELKVSYAIDKVLPPKILKASREQMAACLSGLFDTDGGLQVCTAKGGISCKISYWSTSERLIDQIQYILLHYGIVSTKRSRQKKNINHNREFSLQISGLNAKAFYKEIGFRLKRKQDVLENAMINKSRYVTYCDGVPGIKEEMVRITIQHPSPIVKDSIFPTLKKHLSTSDLIVRKVITREYISAFIEKYGNCGDPFIEILKELSNPNIYYDTIESISDGKCDTYDIHVPDGHEYGANGFFSHNSKIRGLRANVIVIDEFSSLNEEIFNVVIRGFGVVAANPVEKVKELAMIKRMKEKGIWNEGLEKLQKERSRGNQIIFSGTAYYEFNHFFKYWQQWKSIISSKGDSKKLGALSSELEKTSEGLDYKDYAVLRIPYTSLPEGLLDAGIIAQAKATMDTGQFMLEYGACFLSDSNGFYRRSIIEAATTNKPIQLSDGSYVQFHAKKAGDKDRAHVIAIDPAADSDNAAIVVLELNVNHRKIVHCWTTNRERYNKYKQYMRKDEGVEIEEDYYNYIAKKIRELMRSFKTEHIIMDKGGGGIAVAEALASKNSCFPNELPIYLIPDPEDPKFDDSKEGLHILNIMQPSQVINMEANHGMLKDLQDKVLLFPLYDTIELAKAIELDKINDIKIDTYERLAGEIEELKNEMTNIVCTPSSVLGRESFDTPSVKREGSRRGRLRKDRYSALLYANYYARNRDKQNPLIIEYRAIGGTKDTMKTTETPNASRGLYYGPGILKLKPGSSAINYGNFFKRNANY